MVMRENCILLKCYVAVAVTDSVVAFEAELRKEGLEKRA